MRKRKKFSNTRFDVEVLRQALAELDRNITVAGLSMGFRTLDVEHDDATWSHQTIEEFFADYRKYGNMAFLQAHAGPYGLGVLAWASRAVIDVEAPTRVEIETVFNHFEDALQASVVPPEPAGIAPVIFIGHGRSDQWRELKDHLHDKHGFTIESYETGARAGHSIRDILEEMVEASSFAVLVLTGEDEQADGGLRARQNVIHEAGLFQGKLGFPRAIMVLEDGVEPFSNVQGVQYIRFSKKNIKETFGEVLATLRREFGLPTAVGRLKPVLDLP